MKMTKQNHLSATLGGITGGLLLAGVFFLVSSISCDFPAEDICEIDEEEIDCEFGVDLELCQCLPDPDPDPDPDPECDFDELRESCEFGILRLKCECKPEPPPSDVAVPSDYAPILASGSQEGVKDKLFWRSRNWEGLFAYQNALQWGGANDILKVLRDCRWAFPDVFGVSPKRAEELAAIGLELLDEDRAMIYKIWKLNNPDNPRDESGVPIVNRRCPDQPEFCSVTNLKKDVWREFKARLLTHIEITNGFRKRAQEARLIGMEDYDSIAGWCKEWNKL